MPSQSYLLQPQLPLLLEQKALISLFKSTAWVNSTQKVLWKERKHQEFIPLKHLSPRNSSHQSPEPPSEESRGKQNYANTDFYNLGLVSQCNFLSTSDDFPEGLRG